MKKPGFVVIVLVCAVSLILFKTHVGITSLDEDETGQEEIVEHDDHDGPDDNAHDAEDGDHDDDYDNEHSNDHNDSHSDEHGSTDQDEHSVQLDDHQMEEYGIVIETAGPGELQVHAEFPGEVVFNTERVSHVVPYIAGIVREVRKKQGDMAKAG